MHGVWETESPSGVQGRSPGGGLGGLAEKLLKFIYLKLLFCDTHA